MSMADFKKGSDAGHAQMQEEMDLMFNQLSNWRKTTGRQPSLGRKTWESDTEVVVLVELAGVKHPRSR